MYQTIKYEIKNGIGYITINTKINSKYSLLDAIFPPQILRQYRTIPA